jgi:hypothetical protein
VHGPRSGGQWPAYNRPDGLMSMANGFCAVVSGFATVRRGSVHEIRVSLPARMTRSGAHVCAVELAELVVVRRVGMGDDPGGAVCRQAGDVVAHDAARTADHIQLRRPQVPVRIRRRVDPHLRPEQC